MNTEARTGYSLPSPADFQSAACFLNETDPAAKLRGEMGREA